MMTMNTAREILILVLQRPRVESCNKENELRKFSTWHLVEDTQTSLLGERKVHQEISQSQQVAE